MPPLFVPIQGVSRTGVVADDVSHIPANGYLSSGSDLHGAGHMGVGPLDRIIMSLNSGIESEIEYALGALTYYSCNEPKLLNFSVYPLMGNELIKYFFKPFQLILDGKEQLLRPPVMSLAVESLLSLRNAVQDLHNQQWLSQIKSFRKNATAALGFLVKWFYTPQNHSYHLSQFHDLFKEALMHLLDILDPLTCFYIDNAKNDPLFAHLLTVLLQTHDKYIFTVSVKCVHHMLFLSGPSSAKEADAEIDTNNCIDAIQPDHLLVIVRALLIGDEELTYTVLLFLKQYLGSTALHPQYSSSTASSQLHRLRKLVQAGPALRNLHILMKQLPQLIVANLPLVDASKLQQDFPTWLLKRSANSGVPNTTVRLPQKFYDIIITFPEPLRATTWLRCCYEPYVGNTSGNETKDLAAGEVTQISLWKAYENQFEAIWKDRLNAKWPNLLPAVDFIKNVSSAFPNSEAMVVNIPSQDPAQPARKKFIIKGIQPRRFPVNIDVGNFEALRRSVGSEDSSPLGKYAGEVDTKAFRAAVEAFNDSLLSTSEGLLGVSDVNAPWYSPVNALSRDILRRIIESLLDLDTDGVYKNVFRQYNKEWLPQCVYANPGLVEHAYIEGRWLLYLL